MNTQQDLVEKFDYFRRASLNAAKLAPTQGEPDGTYGKGWWTALAGDCETIGRLVGSGKAVLSDAVVDLDAIADEVSEGIAWLDKKVPGFDKRSVFPAKVTTISIPILPINPADEKLVDDLIRRATQNQPKRSLLAPDCISCGGDFGKHKIGCRVPK